MVPRNTPACQDERTTPPTESRRRVRVPAVAGAAARATDYLHPGQLCASADPCEVTTVVGSCVAVVLHSPVLRAGGINHFLLPWATPKDESSTRFGNVATLRLVAAMHELGCPRGSLVAKVFGGACVIDAFAGKHHLGQRNIEVALSVLEEQGIPVVASDVGGRRGRKLVCSLETGLVRIKEL